MRSTAAASFLRSISNTSSRPSSEQRQQQQQNSNAVNNSVTSGGAPTLSLDIPSRPDNSNVIELGETGSSTGTSWKQSQAKSFLSNISSTPSNVDRTKHVTAGSPPRNTRRLPFGGESAVKRNNPLLGDRNNQKHQYRHNDIPQTLAVVPVTSAPASLSNTCEVSASSGGGTTLSEDSSGEAGEEGDSSGIRPCKPCHNSLEASTSAQEDASIKHVKTVDAVQASGSESKKTVYWTYQNSFPFSISTLFGFEKKKNVFESAVENGQQLIDFLEGKIVGNDEGEKEESLEELLEPTSEPYDPYFLDDPEIRGVTRRKVMNLPCMLSTVIPYTNRKEYKKDLNAQFRQKHPDIPLSITLSKIRNLKKATLGLALGPHHVVHISTVALAHTYFEKLTLKQVVSKGNRKTLMATCILLATKFFESTVKLSELFDAVEDVLGITKKKILQNEFVVFKALGFSLQSHPRHMYSHVTRLLQYHNISPREYFGEEQYQKLQELSKTKPKENTTDSQISSSSGSADN